MMFKKFELVHVSATAVSTDDSQRGNDWIPDHPITIVAKAVLPEWVHWHGEQAGLPTHIVDRGIAVATGDIRATPDCAGHRIDHGLLSPTPTQQQPISHHDCSG